MHRCLAPAGGFPSPSLVHRYLRDRELLQKTESVLSQLFSCHQVSFFGSGKQALEVVLQSFPAGTVAVAGYSCPDIVAAAVRAGHRVFPLDVSAETLEPNFQEFDSDILVLSNLYGLVDPVLSGVPVVDDACQAAFSFTNSGERVGTRGLGILSFGRGKAFCGVGGGVALGVSSKPVELADRKIDLLKLQLSCIFERPELYFLPQNLPFLHLGETHYKSDYPHSLISEVQLATALAQLQSEEENRELYTRQTAKWSEMLSESVNLSLPAKNRGLAGSALTRFPILLNSLRQRDYAYSKLHHLGASKSYGAVLTEICRDESRLVKRDLPGAKSVAERLLTLPTHRFVTLNDMERVREVLKRC